MKKILAALLALLMLSQGLPALAEAPAPAALPAVGDTVHGFEVKEIRDYPQIDAKVIRFEHRKTGAELYWFANDDPNRAFALAFRTEATDNTGLPHVFEHATLYGSEKYPSETLLFNLMYQTYNTYMNAMTNQTYTAYPLASLSEAQLLKLAEFYTDSCFRPMILQNEHIFRNQAWRYRLDSADAPLTLEGTVYSEMLGAQTLSRRATYLAKETAFPGAYTANDSGGDPDVIPEMTWESLKAYHDLYYHPSNSLTCLYGKLEHYEDFLALLDRYFSLYEKKEISHDNPDYVPVTEPVTVSEGFPAGEGTGTEHASEINYVFVCKGIKGDPEQTVLMDTMTDLFYSDASALKQHLHDALPYGSFACFIEESGPEFAIVFTAVNVDPGDAETFKAVVDEETAKVAAEGFPAELVDSVQTALTIPTLTMRESNSPVANVLNPFIAYAVNTGDPWAYITYQNSVPEMDDWNNAGKYAQAAAKYLTGSRTTALTTVYPVPGEKEKKEAALAEKLAETKAGMSDEEIAKIVEESHAPAQQTDNSAYLAELRAVDVSTLPEEIRTFEVRDETTDAGVRHLDGVAGVSGIGSVNILLDARGIPQEDLRWVALYAGIAGNLDTEKHTRAELATLKSRYLNSFSVGVAATDEDEGYRPWLELGWTALDDDMDEGYELAWEIVYGTKLDDAGKVLELVQRRKAALKRQIQDSPSGFVIRHQKAATDPGFAYADYVSGIGYYTFLCEAEKLLQTDPEAALERLRAAREWFNNRTGAVTVFAGNEESIALNRQLSDEYLGRLEAKETVPAEYRFEAPAKSEALVTDSGAYHNVFTLYAGTAGLKQYDGGMQAVTSLVTDMLLVPLLRDTYGVYTPVCGLSGEKTLVVYAYRDPNIAETYEVVERLPELVASIEIDQETLDGYILSAYSGYAMPKGELSGALAAAAERLEGKDPERTLTRMRELKKVTPESIRGSAELFAKLVSDGLNCTAGSGAGIREHAEMFGAILDPFAEDAAETAEP